MGQLPIWYYGNFTFLKKTKENSYKVRIQGEAVNQKDELGLLAEKNLLTVLEKCFPGSCTTERF